MNLTYLNVTLTGKAQRWKLYLLDEDFYQCHVPGKEVLQFVPLVREPHALKRMREACIRPSWPLLSRNIVYPIHCWGTQFHGWSLGLAEVQRVPQRSHDHGPLYHPVHTPMPMLPSYESTQNPH